MTARRAAAVAASAVVAACGAPAAPVATPASAAAATASEPAAMAPAAGAAPASPPAPREASQDERLAAIQKAMNDLDGAAQQCWAAAATERFDIAGEISLQIDIAAVPGEPATAQIVRDTAHDALLSACLVQLMAAYRWAPPLYGQAIQLPFRFRAPDGQNTIDRALVAWHGQANVSVAVLLDDSNTGSAAASMFELAIAAGAGTGLRSADRAELWYFLGAAAVRGPSGGPRAVAAGDMMYVPRGGARDVTASAGDLHAMIAIVPGGREGAARSGALPTPELPAAAAARAKSPVILPAAAAKPQGAAMVYADATAIPDRTLSAAIVTVRAGEPIAEHVHAGGTELWYVLAGAGTLTVNGVALPVTATSVVQIPKNTRHAFVATSDVRAVQIFTPAAAPRTRGQP